MTNFGAALKNMVSFSEFNRGQAGKIFDEVKNDGTKIVVKNNNPECVLISVNEYIKMVDEINDMRALLLAVDRMSDFDGEIKDTFSHEEIKKLLGVNTDDCEEVEIEWIIRFNIHRTHIKTC